ncbi:TLD-domain-containing protein [Gigaspora rosea]|uniref:TLD-domain-containing protein n=1 Tax=Gigaspora rosea TaxID=44941 RepID=A0A397W2C3_9GLOM|nr:TLD-domain-containing protein [Gigaspora rosea]
MNNELIQNLLEDFSNLLENSKDFDVKIKIGEDPNIKEFKAHSIILSARSNYFKAALSSQWARRENGIIVFEKPNISPSVFEILLIKNYCRIMCANSRDIGLSDERYIYTGRFSDEKEVSFLDIFIAADEIQLSKLNQKVKKFLLETESAWKFPKDFITVCKHNTFTDLYQIAFELVCKRPRIIFESKDFLKMEEKDLIRLLKSDRLRLEEIEIWEYLIKWGIENTESILDDDLTKWTQLDFIELEKVLHNCIPYIRFLQLSFDELRLIIIKYKNILPDNIFEEIFQHLLDSKYKHNLPKRESVYFFNSKIIDAKDAALIASWIDKKKGMPYHIKDMPYEFELIYQASRENFSIKKFHESCDNKGPTIVIIKVKNSNEIIGGYNPLYWHSDDYNFKTTSKSFIFSLFSLSNGAIPILSYVSFKKEAITQCMTKGPCFGFQDLWIEYKSSQGSVVGISKQNSYEIGIIDKDILEIEEYEVFQINDKQSSFRIMFNKIIKFILLIIILFVYKQLYNELTKEKPIVFVFLNVVTAFVMALMVNLVFMTIGVNETVDYYFFYMFLYTIFQSFAIFDLFSSSILANLTALSFAAAIVLYYYYICLR